MTKALRWFGARLAAQPVATDKAVMATLGMAVALGWAHLSDAELGSVIAAYAAWSVVLVQQRVTPIGAARRLAQDTADQREAEIRAYLDGATHADQKRGRPLRARTQGEPR